MERGRRSSTGMADSDLLLPAERPVMNGSTLYQEWDAASLRSVKTYNNVTCFAIAVNYVVGTGVFSLPFGFYSSGLVLSSVLMFLFSVLSAMAVVWVLETSARAEGACSCIEVNQGFPRNEIAFRKFDYTRLFSIFSGFYGKLICQIVMALYVYGVQWAVGAVFGASLSQLIFSFMGENCDIYSSDNANYCHLTYYLALLGFALVVVPLSCFDVADQAIVQKVMTAYRFIALITMLLTVLIASFYDNPFATPLTDSVGAVSHFAYTGLVEWNGFALMFGSAAVCYNFHWNIPDIIAPVRDKSRLQWVLIGMLSVILVLYVGTGVLCASYFGASTEPLATLNWKGYTGRGGGWAAGEPFWWAYAIRYFVLFFPVASMLSAYPLTSLTLANNYVQMIPSSLRARWKTSVVRISMCLLSSIPPIALAAAFGRLNTIFTYTGLFAFFLQLIFPCVLQLASRRYCLRSWGPDSEKNPYTSIISHPFATWLVLVLSVLSLIFCIVTLADPNLLANV